MTPSPSGSTSVGLSYGGGNAMTLPRGGPFRATAYFLYSYVLRGGFLEGRDGLVFCVMKSEYQRMIATKKHDLRRRSAR